jgi:translocation and assembly module TamA
MFPARPVFLTTKAPQGARILAQIAMAVCTLLPVVAVQAQTLNYKIFIDAPDAFEELLENNLDLFRWRGNPRLDRDQLQRLIKLAPEQVKTLIATEGYYTPQVSAALDTSRNPQLVRVLVDPGPPTLVGAIDLELQGFAPWSTDAKPFDADALRTSWGLPVGQRFRQADWEAAKRDLLRRVIQNRYPRAQLVESSAIVDPDVKRALLKVVLDSGPEVRFGELRIEGLKRYAPAVILNLNEIKPGEVYNEAAMQAFQARLQDTGYFVGVEVSTDQSETLAEEIEALTDEQKAVAPKKQVDNPLILPLMVRVTENKQKNISVGLGVSTNTGNRAQLTYDDLSVYGLRMKSNLIAETKRQGARADFYFPTKPKGYNDSFGAGFERNDVQGEVTAVASLAVRRAWGSPLLERSITLEYLSEQRYIDGQTERKSSKSIPLTYNFTKRALDNLLLPTKGYVFNAQAVAAVLPILTDERFVRLTTRYITYRPMGQSGTLVLRGEAGALGSKQKAGVPATFLFRAGGDQSVRGYGYQELGVREGDAIVGGRYLLTASAEYQYWFKPPWGVAFFYDAGNAADSIKDLKPESGFGVGARWRSPVGPINVDIAYGQAVKKARLHFSLGFTF